MLKSFIPVEAESHFPIQNLPYCIFSTPENDDRRAGVRIGDFVLDLHLLDEFGFFSYYLGARHVFSKPTLNTFMSMGRGAWLEARTIIQNVLRIENPTLQDPDFQSIALHPVNNITLHRPVEIGDFTDFYASREHATNVGIMFRGSENALMPNWTHLPVGYHGRSSSIVISGTDIHRPHGQILPPGQQTPEFSLTNELDFELEMGYFVGPGTTQGQSISTEQAKNHIFGMVLLNDWSARDIQRWEYKPLGPFLAKNFATSISPWVVTMDALEPFRIEGKKQDPEPLPYLRTEGPTAYDIHLEVSLKTSQMDKPETISRSNLKHIYWSITQQLAHHTATGCNLRPGDLLGTGTISGSENNTYGSMLELTWRGENPLQLSSGETRTFLQDGDEIIMSGFCQGEGYRVGFGEVVGEISPSKE